VYKPNIACIINKMVILISVVLYRYVTNSQTLTIYIIIIIMHLKSFFSSVPNHDTLCGGACVFSTFPNFTARRTRIISFALLRKELKYPLNRKLCGPQSRYINLEEKKYLLPYPAVYLNFLSSSC